MPIPYLARLTMRLTDGATRLPEILRRETLAFVGTAQGPEGGFLGKRGDEDLYYTGFALRTAALLDGFHDGIDLDRCAAFLRRALDRSGHTPLPSVETVSLLLSAGLLHMGDGPDVFAGGGIDVKSWALENFARFRREDGGYASSENTPHSSTYHTFLAVATLEMLGVYADGLAEPPKRIFVRKRRRHDGGYVELAQLENSGTNPTAAAVALLRILATLEHDDETKKSDGEEDGEVATRQRCIRFLEGQRMDDGGFRANARIPVSDLLSTFTACVALADLDVEDRLDKTSLERYLAERRHSDGGYTGGPWDREPDVEYTFYGIALAALVATGGLRKSRGREPPE